MHRFWRQTHRLQAQDPGVAAHGAFCRSLEAAVTYDQVNDVNQACWENLARRFQLHEERYRIKLLEAERGGQKGGNAMDADEASIFLGTTHGAKGSAAVCPQLMDHVANTMREEASVMKERRKAHEERALLKKQQKGESKGE